MADELNVLEEQLGLTDAPQAAPATPPIVDARPEGQSLEVEPITVTAPRMVDDPKDVSGEFKDRRRELTAGGLEAELGLADTGASDFTGKVVEKQTEADFQQTRVTDLLPDSEDETIAASIVNAMYSTSRNVAEIPTQAYNGLVDSLEGLLNLPTDLAGVDEQVFDLPQAEGAQTTTGQVARDVAEFLGGFGIAGKALNTLKLFQKGGYKKGFVQGAIADFIIFDDQDALMVDLVNKYPAELAPVIEVLKSDPNDPAVINKARAMLEGSIFGGSADAMLAGFRAVINGRWFRSQFPKKSATLRAEADFREFNVLGDPESDELLIKRMRAGEKEAANMTPDKIKAGESLEEVYINFSAINNPEDVNRLTQAMANADKAGIDKARRGPVRTWARVKLDAKEQNEWAVLRKRMKEAGVTLSDDETLALRSLWAQSARTLAQVAEKAALSSSPTDLYNFRKMLAVHYTIQKEAIGARSEAARALNIWKLPVDGSEGGAELAANLEALLAEHGGKDVAVSLARKVAALASDVEGKFSIDEFVERSALAKTRDVVAQVWINMLLSNPTTHIVNIMSNMGVMGQQVVERGVASRWRALRGGAGGVQPGEAWAMLEGMLGAFKDLMTHNFKTRGMNFLPEDVSSALARKNKIEIIPGALRAESFGIQGTNLGMVADFTDAVTRAPGTALLKSDEIFKTYGYRMNLHALVQRRTMEMLRNGEITSAQFKERKAKMLANPPEELRMESVDAALYQTFTKDPDVFFNRMAQGVRAANGVFPGFGTLLLPFKRTPINIMTYALERSPMAPLVSEWRQQVMRGGAEADLAWTRMATGSMTIMWAMDMFLSGHITGAGPSEPGQRQQFMRTSKPYSVKIGDTWYSYNRADPIGMTLGLGADLAEILQNSAEGYEEEGLDTAVLAAMFAIAKNVTNKTYMQGISGFIEAMSDPDRYGPSMAQGYIGTLIPAGVAQVARQVDPYMRTTQNMLDAIRRRTPGLSKDLPLYRDFWGREVSYRSGYGMIYDSLSPIYANTPEVEPIDEEFGKQMYFPQMHPKGFKWDKGVYQADVDLKHFPHIYADYVKMINEPGAHPAWRKQGLKDTLNDLVTGKHPLSPLYNRASDGEFGGKRDLLEKLIREFRQGAQQKILEKYEAELTPWFERHKRTRIKIQ